MGKKVPLIIRSPKNQRTEHFKRPDHPDFMDATELKKTKFSGLRANQVGLQTEIWVLGEIVVAVSFAAPLSELERKYKEVFGFHMDKEQSIIYVERHVTKEKRK
jgi:hypothetical protein